MTKHVLIVDDEENSAFLLGETLTTLGADYQVETVSSGEEALGKIAIQPFDLVITDLRLPGMNGLELVHHTHQLSPHTRTMLITAYGNDRVETEAQRLQVSHYITKPFQIQHFIQVAQHVLCTPDAETA
jgi:CheY-like chemotaxis protein